MIEPVSFLSSELSLPKSWIGPAPVRLENVEGDNWSAGSLPRIVWRDREPGSSLQEPGKCRTAGRRAGHDNSHYPLVRAYDATYVRTHNNRRTHTSYGSTWAAGFNSSLNKIAFQSMADHPPTLYTDTCIALVTLTSIQS